MEQTAKILVSFLIKIVELNIRAIYGFADLHLLQK